MILRGLFTLLFGGLLFAGCGRTPLERPGAHGDAGATTTCATGGFWLGLVPSALFEAAPLWLVLGDVNGDGRADLVVSLRSSDMLAIALGQGDGSFVQGSRVPTASPADATVIGDFDGDGKADLATVSSGANTLTVFLGNGDGNFREGASQPTGREPFEIVVGDSNGDGAPDLVVRGRDSLALYLNRGNGTFTERWSLAGPNVFLSADATMAMGDFNGDGRDDLAVANGPSSAGLGLYLARADGDLGDATNITPGRSWDSVAAGDLDGDGQPDLAVMTSGLLTALLNRGDGTFVRGKDASSFGGTVVLGDVDGDGVQDAIVYDDDSRYVRISRNRGDGSFEEAPAYGSDEEPFFLAARDLNGDGRADLVMSFWSVPLVDVVLAEKGGSFASEDPRGLWMNHSLGLADLNADGQMDVLLAQFADGGPRVVLTVWLGQKDGRFSKGVAVPMQGLPRSIETSDVNGDGKLDVIAHYNLPSIMEREQVIVAYLGRGDGSLADPIESPHAGYAGSLCTGDLNGDKKADLLLCNYDSRAADVSLGQGSGTFLAPVGYSLDGRCGDAMALADLNGDGHLDLCVASYDSRFLIFAGRGDGSFAPGTAVTTGGDLYSMRVADVTGDGRVDLVATTYLSGTIGVLPGQGDGTFGAWLESPAAFWVGDLVGVADLDDDGLADAAVWDGARLHMLLGQGDGRFVIGPVVPMPETGAPAMLADLNGDGRTDIGTLVQVNGALQWEVFSNQGCRP